MQLQHLSKHAVLGPTLAIPVAQLPKGWEQAQWFTNLTVHPQAGKTGARTPAPIPTAHVKEGWLHFPRFKGIELLGGVPLDDRRTHGEAMNQELVFLGELRNTPPQREATARVCEQLYNLGGAMLVLPCGFGKTVCGLWVVHRMGRRALVLVHTGALADQWAERIGAFLPGARVGRLQQNVVDVEGCDIVVGMIHSLVRREYDRSLLSTFGTVVVDEAHHIAAPWFTIALRKLSARYVLGLSATPERRDGLGHILPWLLGRIAFQASRPDETVNVRIVEYVNPPNQIELRDRQGKPRYMEMLNRITEDATRTRVVVQLIMGYVNMGGRRLIVLSQRRDQLIELERILLQQEGCVCVTHPRPRKRRRKNDCPPSPPPPLPDDTRFTVGNVMGGTPADLRDAGFNATVLLSTYSYAAEGIDIPQLDTLVMASPGVNLEQTVGRILRKHPGKQTPLIVDVKDPFSLFDGMGWKRYNYYTSQNYTVKQEKMQSVE